MSNENPVIQVQVRKRLRLDDLLQLDENEQNASLREHHEQLLQLTDDILDSEEKLAEKRQALLCEFAARLCELELTLFRLMQRDRQPQ